MMFDIQSHLTEDIYMGEVVKAALKAGRSPVDLLLDVALNGVPIEYCQAANEQIAKRLENKKKAGELRSYTMVAKANDQRMHVNIMVEPVGHIEKCKVDLRVGTIDDLK